MKHTYGNVAQTGKAYRAFGRTGHMVARCPMPKEKLYCQHYQLKIPATPELALRNTKKTK